MAQVKSEPQVVFVHELLIIWIGELLINAEVVSGVQVVNLELRTVHFAQMSQLERYRGRAGRAKGEPGWIFGKGRVCGY